MRAAQCLALRRLSAAQWRSVDLARAPAAFGERLLLASAWGDAGAGQGGCVGANRSFSAAPLAEAWRRHLPEAAAAQRSPTPLWHRGAPAGPPPAAASSSSSSAAAAAALAAAFPGAWGTAASPLRAAASLRPAPLLPLPCRRSRALSSSSACCRGPDQRNAGEPGARGAPGGGDAPAGPSSAAGSDAGWTSNLVNLPNSLSVARGLSGPVIAMWIMQDNAEAALVGIVAAGVSDWADGHFARHMKTSSVLGSYLDPLADKVLVASVYVALTAKGLLPLWLAGFVVGRDVLLVGGSFIHRAGVMGWKWSGWREFFRLTPGSSGSAPSAPLVRPLLMSKVNTALQMALVSCALTHMGWDQPGVEALDTLTGLVALTTVGTSAQYWVEYRRGRLMR